MPGGKVTFMKDDPATYPPLEPLAYHRAIVEYLRKREPEIWNWAASQTTLEEHVRDMRTLLLRETYRLDSASHPAVHEEIAAVRRALEIDAPVTLYQAADGTMNAALCFVPGEIHLIFHGPVLEKLSSPERLALIGHELAHFRLWSIEDAAFHVASRILDHALAYPGVAPSHIETARLYRLHTELYADRGGAIAAGTPAPAIATLVKTMTGLGAVDAEAYLRQATELEASSGASRADTHPEIFLRARALDKWWRHDADIEAWIDQRIRGKMSVATLDLLRQHELTAITRGFLARLLTEPAAAGEAVAAQVRRFFPDWGPGEAPADDAALAGDLIDESVRSYMIALSFDLAMADPDSRDEMLLAGARIAKGFGGLELYISALKRDLKMTRQAVAKLLAPLDKAA
jgi:hypothetical protein